MATSNAVHILNNVEALYPRLNTTYKYDTKANDGRGQSVPCEPLDEGAKYELNYRMNKDQAVGLYKDMKAAYNARKAANWPEMPTAKEVFEVQEDGTFVAKSSLKGSYNNELTRKPRQFDARNQLLPDDFQLTTGSTINSQLALIPYSSNNGNGVSLRLRAVQVVKFKEVEQSSPFGEVDGFSGSEGGGFGDDFDDTPAPAPKVEYVGFQTAVAPAPAPKEVKADPKSVADFDTIDDALDNLDFDD